MRLHYQSCGHGRPLIILHGLFGSLDNWQSYARRLAEFFQVLCLDQRNHGRSPHSAEMDYPAMASDLPEFIDEHCLGTVHLLGHSMGGKTAMEFALRRPEGVGRLVVADMAPRPYAARHDRILDGLLALDLPKYCHRTELEAALQPWVPELEVRQFLLKNVNRGPDGRFQWLAGIREIDLNYKRLGEGLTPGRVFSKPTLFVRGERSDYLTADDAPEIRKLFPHAEFQIVPDAGHWLHVENPAVFEQITTEFFLRG